MTDSMDVTRDIERSSAVNESEKRRDVAAALLLGLTVITITSFDYIWYGPVPLWLILVGSGLCISVFHGGHRRHSIRLISHSFMWVILPWLLFVVIVASIDAVKGQIEDNFSKRVLLNISTLCLMVMVGTWASRVQARTVIYLLGLIGMLQGLLCVAQFYKIEVAWEFPITVIKVVGARFDQGITAETTFFELQRVRGTNLFVHKFNPMQGMLASFLLTVVVLNVQSRNSLKVLLWPMAGATLLTFIGMFLTFSRSTIIGVGVTFCIMLVNTRRFMTVFVIVVTLIIGYVSFQELHLGSSAELGRITDFSEKRVTNASRLQQYSYAFSRFGNEPVMGEPAQRGGEQFLVHSVLLRLLMDYGVMGTLPYLLVLTGIARLLWRDRQLSGTNSHVLALASLGSLCVGLIDGWTHSSGFLVRDVTQAGFVGLYLGMVMPQSRSVVSSFVGTEQWTDPIPAEVVPVGRNR